MLKTLKIWGLPLTLALVFAMGLFVFFTPKLADKDQLSCGVANIYLPGGISYWLNCDSPEFMRLSSEPIALLGKENTRQTRPGIIVLANLLSYPVSGVMNLFPTLKDKIQLHHERVDQERADKFRDNFVPNYVAYIILNFLILMGGLVLFVRILGGGEGVSFPLLLFTSLFLFSDLVKAFFLSPHTQMFNYMYPILGVYLGSKAFEGKFFNWRWLVVWSSLLGLGMLVYSSSFAILPVMILGGLYYWYQNRSQVTLGELALKSFTSFALIALPSLIWFAFVYLKTGSYYSHEVEHCNQVVWFFKLFPKGCAELVSVTSQKLGEFFSVLSLELIPVYVLGGLAVLFTLTYGVRLTKIYHNHKSLIFSSLLTSLFFGAFFFFVGLYEWRMLLSSMPPLLLVAALFIKDIALNVNPGQRKVIYGASALVVLCLNLWTLLKAGPYG